MGDFLRKYVLNNFGLKMISLALAFGLWLAIQREPVAEVAVDTAIEFHNVPANLEISSENIPKAQVRLRGPERVVRRLQVSDVYGEINLEGVKPGERTYDLTAREIHRPQELEVVQVVPSEVHLAFDSRMTKEVPVQPRITGTFATGYKIGQVLVSPSTVTITGPKKHVEAVDAATTDPIDVTGDISRAGFTRHPYVSDPLIQVNTTDPVRITVIMENDSATHAH
ncbi:MAG TPA: CdaR family protein [Terriglobales bacterium]|nr:CdaR family protein [Terriglobales bacterium]